MFDFRYHVISLAAVFLALIVGILVGVAISDPDLADRTELELKRDEVARLNERLEVAEARNRQEQAAEEFVRATYPAVMDGRLAGKEIGVVVVGSVNRSLDTDVRTALADAGAALVRMRALRVPLSEETIQAELERRSALAGYVGDDHLADLGRDLGRELVDGGDTPLWDVLATALVEQRRGSAQPELDGIVVLRTAAPQRGETARFLAGFYGGLAGDVPVVGAEATDTEPTAVAVYRRAGFSSVDSIDTRPGKVALAVLLDGGASGHYGVKEGADAVLPRIPSVEPEPEAGG
jgi:Copper transport outer membrane protein, MctB